MAGSVAENLMGSPSKALLIINRTGSRSGNNSSKGLDRIKKMLSGGEKNLDVSNSEVLRVQYNPSSLSIRANAETLELKTVQQSWNESVVQQQNREPSVVLSVQLLFDAVNPKDAFMSDKLRLSAGDAGAAVAGLLKKYTVRTQINGLMGMIMDHSTRSITFAWRDLLFTGRVDGVEGEYTMFNMSGEPVRGTISMSISQSIEDSGESKRWEAAFDNCFQSAAGGKSVLEKAGNLVNLRL